MPRNSSSVASRSPLGLAPSLYSSLYDDGAFEVVVIPVHGKFVVIGLQGPSADRTSSAKTFDPFLAGLTFPGSSN